MARAFWKNNRGNVATMFGLALVPLLLGVGAAVDMVRIHNVNTTLQAAVDEAALAGATSKKINDKKNLKAIVQTYLNTNQAFTVLEKGAKVTQGIDTANGSFFVKVEGKMKTSFMKLAGIKTVKINAISAVGLGIQGMEVALVLDNTGSMAGSKLSSLKVAAKQFVSILESSKADYADLKFGLVPFSKYVNVGLGNASASWIKGPSKPASWNGCVGSQASPKDVNVGASGGKFPAIDGGVCPTPIVPLTTNTMSINANIDAMVAVGNTYVAGGVLWGWNVLDSSQPFTEGKTPAQLKAISGRKVMVVMTDGTNTASPLYPSHDGVDSKLADNNFATLCTNVKAQQIEIYTILFEEPSPVIRDLMRNCASDPSKFFDTTSSAALVSAFEGIGKELAGVRLIQ